MPDPHARLFRKLRPDEFHAAHAILVNAAARLVSKGIRQWTTAFPEEPYRLSHEKGCNYGLMRDGELAVVMTLSHELPAVWAPCVGTMPVWWLSKLATAPGHHGLGLGSVAVRLAVRMLSAQGADRLCLDCVHGEGYLVDFYRGLGFRTIDRRNVQFSTGTFDMVLMDLQLPKSGSL